MLQSHTLTQLGNMANLCAHKVAFSLILLLMSTFPAQATEEQTRTTEFDVRPGGMVQTFTDSIGGYACSFLCAAQGGTNEKWLMSVGLSDDDKLFSCSVWRPTGISYLFFTQFKMELEGTKIEHADAFSQAAVTPGQGNVALGPEEYTVGESTVTHTDGRFKAQLAKLMVVGRTRHEEL
ncbi:myeloid-derived growth factor isoform X1 [Dunckerocampus dactyliophorus]|uniref:myeloid-derived growth factor isoform X1 n=1 Tax=Dunckerocampus dactyliophorus TaxID=161453 RepID=UPI0024053682|nr:myeloid-derived growth factor isoform X1 [Dunckerocampus dactyliophorus]